MRRVLSAANVEMVELCKRQFKESEYAQLQHAIEDDYYFEFVIDRLPMWGFVGETKLVNGTQRSYLFTHLHFHLGYNGDQVVEATVSTDAQLEAELTSDTPTSFTYSVT